MAVSSDLRTELDAVIARCRARWPSLRLTEGQAAAAIEAGIANAADPAAALAALHAEDLYLAAACALGDEAALAEFESRLLPAALRAAARLDGSRDSADELAQRVRRRLFTAEPGKKPRIATYAGRASLETWTHAVVLRAAGELRASLGRESASLDERLGEVATGGSAELELIRAQLHEEFRACFGAALASLPRRARTMLRLHVVDGVTLDGLAVAYGAHRATVARWLASSRSTLLTQTRARLASSLKLNPTEIDSLIDRARSRLEISIARFLESAGDAAAPN